ncbi:MAG: HU family DNA-binding protein [Gemmataceae bacterium]
MAKQKSSEPAKAMPKTSVYKTLAEKTGLEPKQVASVFEALEGLIKTELSKKGPGEFSIPGLIKLKLIKKPATKAGKKPNPFKPGEMMEVKAKPASVKVKPVVLKGLKDMNK